MRRVQSEVLEESSRPTGTSTENRFFDQPNSDENFVDQQSTEQTFRYSKHTNAQNQCRSRTIPNYHRLKNIAALRHQSSRFFSASLSFVSLIDSPALIVEPRNLSEFHLNEVSSPSFDKESTSRSSFLTLNFSRRIEQLDEVLHNASLLLVANFYQILLFRTEDRIYFSDEISRCSNRQKQSSAVESTSNG